MALCRLCAASITATNFAAKYEELVQSLNSGNWAAVDYTTTSYPRPTVYSAYTHSQIFADFTAPLAQARSWLRPAIATQRAL